jgi:dTDP-4-amino-4,6-dideoxygalactose transaminase
MAEEIGDRTISLPMHPNLSEDEQVRVVRAVASAWNELASMRK